MHNTGVGTYLREGTGEAITGGPVLEYAVENTWLDLGAVKCCDITDSVNLQRVTWSLSEKSASLATPMR